MSIFEASPQLVIGLLYAVAALTAVTVLLTVIVFLNFRNIKQLRGRYNSLMRREDADGVTLERLIEECLYQTKSLESSFLSQQRRISYIEGIIPDCFQKFGIVRYNPFDDTGGDLSYAIAILDASNTGVILNGIYSRSGSFTYAKEIEKGASVQHKLSPEELQALQLAIMGEQNKRR